MADVIIVPQFEIFIIVVFGMHISFIILQVSTIMEVPLPSANHHYICTKFIDSPKKLRLFSSLYSNCITIDSF